LFAASFTETELNRETAMKWMIVLVLMIACVALICDAAAISLHHVTRAADADRVTTWLQGLLMDKRSIIPPSQDKRAIIHPPKLHGPAEQKRGQVVSKNITPWKLSQFAHRQHHFVVVL